MYEYTVQFFPIARKLKTELSDHFYKPCQSCDKEVYLDYASMQKMPAEMISGDLFCNFCVKRSVRGKRVFIFSTRTIICHMMELALSQQNHALMYPCQVRDYVEEHRQSGLRNYCMDYDEESFNWFVDLSLVGESQCQIPFREVERTVVEIFSCFNQYAFGMDLQPAFAQVRDKMLERTKTPEQTGPVVVPTFGGFKSNMAKAMSFSLRDLS